MMVFASEKFSESILEKQSTWLYQDVTTEEVQRISCDETITKMYRPVRPSPWRHSHVDGWESSPENTCGQPGAFIRQREIIPSRSVTLEQIIRYIHDQDGEKEVAFL